MFFNQRKFLTVVVAVLAAFVVLLFVWALRRGAIRLGNWFSKSDTKKGVFPLSYGSGMGDRADAQPYVLNVQMYYNTLAGIPSCISEDGKWGDDTENAMAWLAANSRGIITAGSGSNGGAYQIDEQQHERILSFLRQNQ